VQKLVDAAADADTDERKAIARQLLRDGSVGAPPGNWPVPSARDRQRAHSQSQAAAVAARNQLARLGIKTLRLREFPDARIAWQPLWSEEELPPAPLVYSLVDEEALRHTTILLGYLLYPSTASLFEGDVRRNLMQRLNAFAELEVDLWWLAADGGHPHPPPYAVRYDVARWLWGPSIAGTILCLRCGDGLRYARRERRQASLGDIHRNATRTARCRACSRGRENDWPDHAIEPYRRGTWLLRCTSPGCDRLFRGSRQARHCERHRANRLTAGKRTRPI
jgi:hypothetical protein